MALDAIHHAAMWEHADDGNYERAALHALRQADLNGDDAAAAVIVAQAQVFATLALARTQEVRLIEEQRRQA